MEDIPNNFDETTWEQLPDFLEKLPEPVQLNIWGDPEASQAEAEAINLAQTLKEQSFQQVSLLGPSVIDFEYQFAAQALFAAHPVPYDAATSLLYVDRRGAPENKQLGFNLMAKINWFASMVRLDSYASRSRTTRSCRERSRRARTAVSSSMRLRGLTR